MNLPTHIARGVAWAALLLASSPLAVAATGQTAFMPIHAGYALNIGVPEEELKEVVHVTTVTTVTTGFPRAIAAPQALSELFAQRRGAADTPKVQP